MTAVYVECPECGWDGPHDGFALNEAECGDCHCEFSFSQYYLPDAAAVPTEPTGGQE